MLEDRIGVMRFTAVVLCMVVQVVESTDSGQNDSPEGHCQSDDTACLAGAADADNEQQHIAELLSQSVLENYFDEEKTYTDTMPLGIKRIFLELRSKPYNRTQVLAYSRSLRNRGFKQQQEALMNYWHVLEHDSMDPAAQETYRLADKVFDAIFRSVPSEVLTYTPKNIVFKSSRDRMSKNAEDFKPLVVDIEGYVAFPTETAEAVAEGDDVDTTATVAMIAIDGATNDKVSKSKKATKKISIPGSKALDGSMYIVHNLLTPTQCEKLLHVHRREITSNMNFPSLICDGTKDGELFMERIRAAQSSPQTLSEAFTQEALWDTYFVSGHNCLRDASAHLWTPDLPVTVDVAALYTGEYALVDSVYVRLRDVLGTKTHMGHAITTYAFAPGSSYEQHTDCSRGAQYSPRKNHAVTVLANIGVTSADIRFPKLNATVRLTTGQAVVVYNFALGQECDERLAWSVGSGDGGAGETSSPAVLLHQTFDNMNDPTMAARVYNHVAPDVKVKFGGPTERFAYQPVEICTLESCRRHLDSLASIVMRNVYNEQERIRQKVDVSKSERETIETMAKTERWDQDGGTFVSDEEDFEIE